MDELPIYTLIHSQCQILDYSGRVPFSVVFGLCRRSSKDTDARPLVLDTRQSVFDVPYALANNLLKVVIDDANFDQSAALAAQQPSRCPENQRYIILPSPVGRTVNWRRAMVTYRCQISPNSELAPMLKTGKKHEIRVASKDLGVKWYSYSHQDHLLQQGEGARQEAKQLKLVCTQLHGRCRFTVVPSLPRPPTLHTNMRLIREDSDSKGKSNSPVILQISVTNTHSAPVTVQTCGQQHYLVSWGPMQPKEDVDTRRRIIDPDIPAPGSSLQVVDEATGRVMHCPPPLGPCRPGPQRDPRPKLDSTVTLAPGRALVRLVDIGPLLVGLPNGDYGVQLEPRAMWWCEGSRDEFAEGGDDRIPQRLWNRWIPPVMLQCEDVVGVRVEGRLPVP